MRQDAKEQCWRIILDIPLSFSISNLKQLNTLVRLSISRCTQFCSPVLEIPESSTMWVPQAMWACGRWDFTRASSSLSPVAGGSKVAINASGSRTDHDNSIFDSRRTKQLVGSSQARFVTEVVFFYFVLVGFFFCFGFFGGGLVFFWFGFF